MQASANNSTEEHTTQAEDQVSNVVEEQIEAEPQSAVSELEKQLDPVQQNLAQVKVDLTFDDEDNHAVKDDMDVSCESVTDTNHTGGDVGVTIENKKRKQKSVDDKMERYKKYLKDDMRKRQKVVSNFDPENHIKDSVPSGSKKAKQDAGMCQTVLLFYHIK